MDWQVGVTTVWSRATDGTLHKTLASLSGAGFDQVRLFVDGKDGRCQYQFPFANEVTFREPVVSAWGNWLLGLMELYVRDPSADRYAMFQDDILCVHNLRGYLDARSFPIKGYWNLYTAKSNETLLRDSLRPRDPEPGRFFLPGNHGRGALALVFNREAVKQILLSPDVVDKPRQTRWPTRKIDGTVVDALAKVGIQEWVHWPSLVQHVGVESTLSSGMEPRTAPSFPGEDFDVWSFIPTPVPPEMPGGSTPTPPPLDQFEEAKMHHGKMSQ